MRWHSIFLCLLLVITGQAFQIEFSVVELFEENPRDVVFLFLASKSNSVDNLRTLVEVFRVPTINYILPHALMDEWDEETIEELKHNLFPNPELHEILLPCVALFNRPILANEFFKSPTMYTYGDNLADCNVEYQKDIHPETYLAMLKWILANIPKGKWNSSSWQWMVTWRLPKDIRKEMITLLLPYMDAPVIAHLVKTNCLIFRECLYELMSKDKSGEMDATLFGIIQSASLLSKRHIEKLRLLVFSIIRVSPHLIFREDHFLRHMWKWSEAQRHGWRDIFTFWQASFWAFKVARDHPHCGSEVPLELILSAHSRHDPFVFNLDVQRVFSQVSLAHVRPELVQSFVEQVQYPHARSKNWYQEFASNPDSPYLPLWNRSLKWRINKWREAVICACSADLFYINTEALSRHPISAHEALRLLLENVMVYDNLPPLTDHDNPITPHIQRHFTHPITFDGKEFHQFRSLLIYFMVNVFPKASELGWLTVGPQETCISNLALLSLAISSWSFLLWEGQSMLDFSKLGLCMDVRPDCTFRELSRMLSFLYCEWHDDDAFPKIIGEKLLGRYYYYDCFTAYELYELVTGGIKM